MPRSSGSSLFPVNFITGTSDGLLLPAAACIIALPLRSGIAVIPFYAGLGISVAGAVVFGLARYFGEKEEISHHHPGLAAEEAAKELALLEAIGIAPELIDDMKPEMEAERMQWLREIKEHEMGWEEPDGKRARQSGIHTGLGFLAGGLWVSLLAYLLLKGIFPLVLLSVFFATAGLFGWVKAGITDKPRARMAVMHICKAFIICCCAFLAAFLVHMGHNPRAAFLFDEAR